MTKRRGSVLAFALVLLSLLYLSPLLPRVARAVETVTDLALSRRRFTGSGEFSTSDTGSIVKWNADAFLEDATRLTGELTLTGHPRWRVLQVKGDVSGTLVDADILSPDGSKIGGFFGRYSMGRLEGVFRTGEREWNVVVPLSRNDSTDEGEARDE